MFDYIYIIEYESQLCVVDEELANWIDVFTWRRMNVDLICTRYKMDFGIETSICDQFCRGNY